MILAVLVLQCQLPELHLILQGCLKAPLFVARHDCSLFVWVVALWLHVHGVLPTILVRAAHRKEVRSRSAVLIVLVRGLSCVVRHEVVRHWNVASVVRD